MFEPWNEELARDKLAGCEEKRGGLLPALHVIQSTFGHVPEAARDLLADLFNLSRAEVLGVARYYDDFRDTPPDRPVIQVCRGEACQALGAEQLFELAKHRPGVEVRQVFCLGNCAAGPAARIGDTIAGRLTAERLEDVIVEAEEGSSDD